jgi:hypothetical protein
MTDDVDKGLRLQLNDAERNTAVWLRIREHLLARLDHLRRVNDNDAPHDTTIRTRAQIAEVQKMLAAGDTQD